VTVQPTAAVLSFSTGADAASEAAADEGLPTGATDEGTQVRVESGAAVKGAVAVLVAAADSAMDE